jgi:heme/copper-type cytochrome/quinol oxidase subunit 2
MERIADGLSAEQKDFPERQKAARAGVWLYQQTSPNVVIILATALICAIVGFIGVTFVVRFRRSTQSSTLKEQLMTVSN